MTAEQIGFSVVALFLWALIGLLPGGIVGHDLALPGDNDRWECTRWENKPGGDCTQLTRKEQAKP